MESRLWSTSAWHHAVEWRHAVRNTGRPTTRPAQFQSHLYNFTVQVTDSATPTHNVGTEAFTLRLIAPVSFQGDDHTTQDMSPDAVIAADFNGDGNLDLAIANKRGRYSFYSARQRQRNVHGPITLATGNIPTRWQPAISTAT